MTIDTSSKERLTITVRKQTKEKMRALASSQGLLTGTFGTMIFEKIAELPNDRVGELFGKIEELTRKKV
ncbi:MAG: hypothetical protein JW942_07875 [Opitutales bacterium]|nr:hypothetical protein [Opitutales bacterium]